MSYEELPEVRGTGVVPGFAFAPAVWVRPRPELPQEGPQIAEDERDVEFERFQAAANIVAHRLNERSKTVSAEASEVLVATSKMATDRGWLKQVKKNINAGHRAEYAAVMATEKFVSMFEAAGGLMAERTTDLKDVRDRVLAELRGEPEPGLPQVDGQAILFADDLAPADTATLDREHIVALVTVLGGPTSHTAIIARQLNIPCIVAVGESLRDIMDGAEVLVDGDQGTVERGVSPDAAQTKVLEFRETAERISQWQGPAKTRDGHRVQLLANVADGRAARQAATSQAEGIGLYRTELSFLSASHEPTVEEQAEIYLQVLEAFPSSKVVIRTLDAGSDKPISYATLPDEENPSLGVRGVRIARENEGLLTRQLDAIAEAAKGRDSQAPVWVMAPMIATAEEAQWFGNMCRQRGLIPGAMIEVPAAALMADTILPHLDFVSVGTNDLTQYTMAADRLSPQLAHLTDPWQPAVLRLIKHTCEAARKTGTPVGVCGEAAADPRLAAVLTGLGVSSLSTAANAVAAVGAHLSDVDFDTCVMAAQRACEATSATEARDVVATVLGY